MSGPTSSTSAATPPSRAPSLSRKAPPPTPDQERPELHRLGRCHRRRNPAVMLRRPAHAHRRVHPRPGLWRELHRQLGTVNGSIVSSQVTMTGNAGGTIKGTVINVDDNLLSPQRLQRDRHRLHRHQQLPGRPVLRLPLRPRRRYLCGGAAMRNTHDKVTRDKVTRWRRVTLSPCHLVTWSSPPPCVGHQPDQGDDQPGNLHDAAGGGGRGLHAPPPGH